MKQEVKEKWVAALRSGEYKQGQGKLKSKDEYCCLGVLCDIYKKETGLGKWVDEASSYTNFVTGKTSDYKVPPNEVSQWADLKDRNPNIRSHGTSLAELNDEGYSFKQIADLIATEL